MPPNIHARLFRHLMTALLGFGLWAVITTAVVIAHVYIGLDCEAALAACAGW